MNTIEDFKAYVADVEATEGYTKPLAFGLGIRRSKGDKVLDVNFPGINWDTAFGTAALLQDVTGFKGSENGFVTVSKAQLQNAFDNFAAFHGEIEKHPNIILIQQLLENIASPSNTYQEIDVVAYFLFDKDQPVNDAVEGYFKLQCLSQLHVLPHGLSLEGVFGKLNNIAWTNQGPILPEDLSAERIKATFKGENIVVTHVDKFPYMVNYHVPNGVRIASGSQVRLGAHCAVGTTVMPAGYINFNAGTKGNAMIEGRVSAGVVVGHDSDLGGGVSIMGTLSGGNKNVISIGDKCLLGANSGTGISLGFGCTIAAGVYVTAAAKVWLYDANKQPVDINGNKVEERQNIVKGAELNGKDKLLFLLDSTNGHLTCRPNPKTIELNEALHVKN
ncbi:tetrahydrodipicolinate N-succinyltransferase N-terminal domain-containing protein [Wenyingzhuangia marina]|uniref:2,3,4,5-tetrahydropyridine-2-carboxylate N-succinyltransferase n=1 Tax=Wenyingzhuangia marina TaxID=1195760 RepID=A0A1M5WP93_9FLAO|nr:tetrahydrodipicolinate N-succinyltransferase N-terminal domain-containing protein [Wenyingzhuangia marina]GGF79772.1 2,3,4,5-tetrahydropyridine-2,6-dicarboxylate N-succinyltransferase [Wenyingzhuangia marina]SHH89445.1 2,3,4,5-tetrahydropyridine-2-carboxylate N-succinyltransferase [Wenyingzhuangia marina]